MPTQAEVSANIARKRTHYAGRGLETEGRGAQLRASVESSLGPASTTTRTLIVDGSISCAWDYDVPDSLKFAKVLEFLEEGVI